MEQDYQTIESKIIKYDWLIVSLLQLVFIVIKGLGLIKISWAIAFLPLFINIGIYVLIALVVFVAIMVSDLCDKINAKKSK